VVAQRAMTIYHNIVWQKNGNDFAQYAKKVPAPTNGNSIEVLVINTWFISCTRVMVYLHGMIAE
jgi:hypothetical protein